MPASGRRVPTAAGAGGRTATTIAELDRALTHFADIVARDVGVDILTLPGGGAAGGLGAGLIAFTGARIEPGIEAIATAVRLDARLAGAGVVLTGEGSLERQSAFGDVDGDGDLDWFVTAIASSFPCLGGESRMTGMCEWRPSGNRLFADEGDRRFSDQTAGAGVQLREAGVATHFLGQSESTLHFGIGSGLGAAAGEPPRVARVTVSWPASGIRTVLEDVPANASIVIREGEEGYTPQP